MNNKHAALVQSLLQEKDDPQPEMEQWRKALCLSAPNFVSSVREESICFIFCDLETGGLGKNVDILQFAFAKAVSTEVSPENLKDSKLSFHILPTKKIDASASKVTGSHVRYKIGEKTLVNREGRVLLNVTPAVAAQKIVYYLNSKFTLNNGQILLVAQNGFVFDRSRFIRFLKNSNALDKLLNKEQIYFGDSLPPCRKTFKSYISSRNLCNVYQFLFQETFEAHGALADLLPLRRICLQSIHSDVLTKQVKSEAKPLCFLPEKSDFDVHRVQNTNDLFCSLKLDKPSKRLANSGTCHWKSALLLEMWSKFGTIEYIRFFARKERRSKIAGVTRDVKELCHIYKSFWILRKN